ncbi:AGE family epimerase/isomerase [Pedobacter sp. MC2016-05]|uniref:AGE family epimerase/isomerase n=1 Tax=Pedobacter sp. MC2016-05 TaxID=2994474 RepID=UPI0022459D5F|nr:AGE family epimerase/isomerase [Pedobacter sp. MC2016-05]MCX2474932.1 AGE family epimerase/isomerase [Pedobacter sp. MC2016-05]
MDHKLLHLSQEFKTELDNILNYWKTNTIDLDFGGFVGQIAEGELINPDAEKGSVLNARILWSLSAAYNFNGDLQDLYLAQHGFQYIKEHFIDKQYGGVYWSLDHTGMPRDRKKQIYAIAFTIYGLSEYFLATGDNEALDLAIVLFRDIESHSFDPIDGGYFEAFAENWDQVPDLRLSQKDANEKKTMNTHLHILEAYTTLYKIWPDEHLSNQIIGLLGVFDKYIINTEGHLNLFFDEKWNRKSSEISYGHDIEASWLLLEAAEMIKHQELISHFKSMAVKIAEASAEGMDKEAIIYEYSPVNNHRNDEKHWWVQAEAMVGFLNAFELSKNRVFFELFDKIWNYTKKQIVDHQNGEWFWGRNADGSVMANQDKAGLWKCPYHNSRACMEIISRLKHMQKD